MGLILLGVLGRLAVVDVLPLLIGAGGGVEDMGLAGEADEVAGGVVVADDLRSGGLDELLAGGRVDDGLEADAEHEVADLRREVLQVRDRGIVAGPQVDVDDGRVGVVHAVQVEDRNDGVVLHGDLLEREGHANRTEKLEVLGGEVIDIVVLMGLKHGTNSF